MNRKDAGERRVELSRPQLLRIVRPQQARLNADLAAVAVNAAVEHSVDAELVRSGETLTGWKQRIRFWTALALLRCVMSSPAAAMAAIGKRLTRGALEAQDPYLNGHSRRVARHATIIGRKIGLCAEDVARIRKAVVLHDVGKLAIPDSILNKPGPLDEQEWEIMRLHTEIGERIILAAPALSPAAPLVRASHERFDGAGYPDGLRGEEIPLGASIIAVCDAFDAMTSKRVYCDAIDTWTALERLRECAGTQFHPDVVVVVCELIEQMASTVSRPARRVAT